MNDIRDILKAVLAGLVLELIKIAVKILTTPKDK